MTIPFMPNQPWGPYKRIIDLMEQIDRGGWEEAQRQSIRRQRLWDEAMPGIERLSDYYDQVLQGNWQDTPIGRAATSQVKMQTSKLKQQIRERMAQKGLSGTPMEAGRLAEAGLQTGRALNQLPLGQIGRAEQFTAGTLPQLAGMNQPRFPKVQTGALQYLGQVMPYNLGLERLWDKWAQMQGQGEGMIDIFNRQPAPRPPLPDGARRYYAGGGGGSPAPRGRRDIARLFNARRS